MQVSQRGGVTLAPAWAFREFGEPELGPVRRGGTAGAEGSVHSGSTEY
jgi:hypothetical protein